MSNKPVFCTRFNPPPSLGVDFKDASLTRQEFMEECDLNSIMKRYASGMPLPVGGREPMYGDFSEVPDYATAFTIVQKAQEGFDALPSQVRDRFGNDPHNLMDFLHDEKNRDEAISLGLIEKPVNEKPSVSVPEKGGSVEPPPTTNT